MHFTVELGVLWLALKGITAEHSVYLARLRPQIDDGRFVPRQIRVVSTQNRGWYPWGILGVAERIEIEAKVHNPPTP